LLDKDIGFRPYITNCKVNTQYALSMLCNITSQYVEEKAVVGILRPYSHRHGYGPLLTEIKDVPWTKDEHNIDNQWQKEFRYGWFDCQLTKYAVEKSAVQSVALTNFDRMDSRFKVCENYYVGGNQLKDLTCFVSSNDIHDRLKIVSPIKKYKEIEKENFPEYFEEVFGVPISIISNGVTAKDKHWR
jgi:adenylosuccinate synthase